MFERIEGETDEQYMERAHQVQQERIAYNKRANIPVSKGWLAEWRTTKPKASMSDWEFLKLISERYKVVRTMQEEQKVKDELIKRKKELIEAIATGHITPEISEELRQIHNKLYKPELRQIHSELCKPKPKEV